MSSSLIIPIRLDAFREYVLTRLYKMSNILFCVKLIDHPCKVGCFREYVLTRLDKMSISLLRLPEGEMAPMKCLIVISN